MSLLAAMKLLIVTSIVLNLMALAMRAHARDVLHMFRNWRLGLRAFVAMFGVVPAIALAMSLNFGLRPEVKIALLVLSLSPVPPLLPKKSASITASCPSAMFHEQARSTTAPERSLRRAVA